METLESQSDEELMAAYRCGDTVSFQVLLKRHAVPLQAFLTKMLGQREEAQDLVQETFRRVVCNAQKFDCSRPFKAWLYTIATNGALDVMRHSKRKSNPISLEKNIDENNHVALLENLPDTAPTPMEVSDLADRKTLVRQALESLPPRQKATLILVYFHHMTYTEAAEALDCSVGTVKTQMSRALRTLYKLLPKMDGSFNPGGDKQ